MSKQVSAFSLAPSNIQEAMQFADMIAQSEMVPKDYRNKSSNVLIAVQMGAEVGLPPMQALQNIAVINGRPSLWGDAVKAIILGSSLCEKFEESFDDSNMTASVLVKRQNHKERTVSFSQADAKQANLWGKQGPWTQYPKRMLQMRARAFAARDEFADVLKGLSSAEEMQDTPPERDITPGTQGSSAEQLSVENYPKEQFESNLPKWEEQILTGNKTSDKILAFLEKKGARLSEQQTETIKQLGEK